MAGKKEDILVENAVGRICADLVFECPPGYPVLI